MTRTEIILQERAIYKKFYDDALKKLTEFNPQPLLYATDDLYGLTFETTQRLSNLNRGIPYCEIEITGFEHLELAELDNLILAPE